jgi:hypothetical protein
MPALVRGALWRIGGGSDALVWRKSAGARVASGAGGIAVAVDVRIGGGIGGIDIVAVRVGIGGGFVDGREGGASGGIVVERDAGAVLIRTAAIEIAGTPCCVPCGARVRGSGATSPAE